MIQSVDVISLMEKTLNYIDSRLSNHGRRVSYIVYHLLQSLGGYSKRQQRDICIAALLHDIGAYKTEEIDKMTAFETQETLDHAIYGYLFLKHLSPIGNLASSILYHHTSFANIDPSNSQFELAQIMFIADRLDILSLNGMNDKKELLFTLNKQRDVLFSPVILEKVCPILEEKIDFPVTENDLQHNGIDGLVEEIPLTHDEKAAYLKMIILFIDFRSHHTFNHTVVTASISESLARLCGVDETSRLKLWAGAWFHDIGKTGIPLHLLEKPGKLTPEEMAVVQKHVCFTDEILKGSISDEVRHIAVNHHEKLDGSGYPGGLHGNKLSVCERILVIADIFSALCGVRSYKQAFPKEKVISILENMKNEGLIDPGIVDLAVCHYDEIMEAAQESMGPYDIRFEMIKTEFQKLQAEFEQSV